jgi:hypothetical protein
MLHGVSLSIITTDFRTLPQSALSSQLFRRFSNIPFNHGRNLRHSFEHYFFCSYSVDNIKPTPKITTKFRCLRLSPFCPTVCTVFMRYLNYNTSIPLCKPSVLRYDRIHSQIKPISSRCHCLRDRRPSFDP